MTDEPLSRSEIPLYQTEDGRTRIQCRFQDETVWLTQKLMADLFQIAVGTATIRRYRIVQNEGRPQFAREVEHYRLEAITPRNAEAYA
jgi:hypothetical protein